MTPERWHAITGIFQEALARDSVAREPFLAEQCDGDPALRAEVDALLAAHGEAGSFGDRSFVARGGGLLAPGTELGVYRIDAFIAAGGMGEVYRATDTRLNRTVAIKILPPHLRASPTFHARFAREARTISQLTHPHICTLHDIGRVGDIDFLVMEHLEGETLAVRLTRGAVPLDEALRIGGEIASALDHAHRRGLVHRDLKPGNVMLTRSGAKLLDFGLAKLRAAEAGTAAAIRSGETAPGTLLGTVQYMAPEQLDGREADARTDIWALGCVLYELLTGRPAFDGSSPASLIAAILSQEPAPVSAGQPLAPPLLDHLVRTCLAKDPDERWQAAADVRRQLQWVARRSDDSPTAVRRSPRRFVFLGLVVAAVAALTAVVAIPALRSLGSTNGRTEVRFTIEPPAMEYAHAISISPDGRMLAFSASDSDGTRRVFVRALDALTMRSLPGTDGAFHPFWSADSRHIGFSTLTQLKRVALAGGLPQTVCNLPGGTLGGTWSSDNVIVFTAQDSARRGIVLHRIAAAGGTASEITKLDVRAGEIQHSWPSFLPDGRHFLYLARNSAVKDSAIWVGALDGGAKRRLITAFSNAVFAPPGLVIFRSDATLMAQRIDTERLQLTGEPVQVAKDIVHSPQFGRGAFDISQNRTLMYRTGHQLSQLIWRERDGRQSGSAALPLSPASFRLSPDGHRVVFAGAVGDTPGSIWVYDLDRDVRTRVTTDVSINHWPVWSPDGLRIGFDSSRDEKSGVGHVLYETAANGATDERVLVQPDPGFTYGLFDWSPHAMLFMRGLPGNDRPPRSLPLWVLPSSGGRKPFRYFETHLQIEHAQISPNGRWLAYDSDLSGASEVFVRPFPNATAGQWQISGNGGLYPRWSRDGRELFYYDYQRRRLMAVSVAPDREFEVLAQTPLFDVSMSQYIGGPAYPYDVMPDGKRFLLLEQSITPQTSPLTVVLNWSGIPR